MPYRGGNWNNGVRAGVFALNLNNARSNVNSNIGFRPALLPNRPTAAVRYYRPIGFIFSTEWNKGAYIRAARSESRRKNK
ncbi:hypothetical protein FACS18949_02940 [Clostridia bacterium]|nr:hypothetical protein FACS18949_02940 [Clostridia bacterium]